MPVAEKKKLKIRLTEPQADFLDSTVLYSGFVGGRGAGKSFIGAYKFFRRVKPKRLYLVTAPTFPLMRDATLRSFMSMARLLNRSVTMNKSDMIATLPKGSQVLFRTTSDPELLRGPNLSGAWMDEGSLSPEESFDIILPSLRERGEQGWLDITFTPKGKAHWTYKRLGNSAPDTFLVHSHTDENPFLPPNFAETITKQYGSGLLAQQELGGEFLDMGNTEWPYSYFEREDFYYTVDPQHIILRVLFYDGAGSSEAKIGTKDGKRDSDWHAASILSLDNRGHLYYDQRLWRGSQERAGDTLIDICSEPGRLDCCGLEANFGGEIMIPLLNLIAEKRKRQDLMSRWRGVLNNIPKLARIRRLGFYLANGTLHIKDNPGGRETVRQLEQFPLCDHDDGPDAMDGARELMSLLMSGS